MRMSYNGCRVLRKGCIESCIHRPCIQWISAAESQVNATIFLAKFYGRAGLTNLISNSPEHLRPAILRSLLYEECGRMVNPVSGLLGLVWSGKWAECQAGVDSIVRGSFSAVSQGDFMSSDCKCMMPMGATSVRELRRSVKYRSRFKGPSHANHKGREGERVPLSNHIQFSSIPDDGGDATNAVHSAAVQSKFNDKVTEKCSTIFSGQEQDEFIGGRQARIPYSHDICNLKSSQPEAACNPVGLELTLVLKVPLLRRISYQMYTSVAVRSTGIFPRRIICEEKLYFLAVVYRHNRYSTVIRINLWRKYE